MSTELASGGVSVLSSEARVVERARLSMKMLAGVEKAQDDVQPAAQKAGPVRSSSQLRDIFELLSGSETREGIGVNMRAALIL